MVRTSVCFDRYIAGDVHHHNKQTERIARFLQSQLPKSQRHSLMHGHNASPKDSECAHATNSTPTCSPLRTHAHALVAQYYFRVLNDKTVAIFSQVNFVLLKLQKFDVSPFELSKINVDLCPFEASKF